jgi:hypothetical protein
MARDDLADRLEATAAETAAVLRSTAPARDWKFVFEIDLGQANLEARRAALQEFLQQHPAPEPFLPLKKIDAGDSGADCLIRESGARVEPGVDAVLHSPSCLLRYVRLAEPNRQEYRSQKTKSVWVGELQ